MAGSDPDPPSPVHRRGFQAPHARGTRLSLRSVVRGTYGGSPHGVKWGFNPIDSDMILKNMCIIYRMCVCDIYIYIYVIYIYMCVCVCVIYIYMCVCEISMI